MVGCRVVLCLVAAVTISGRAGKVALVAVGALYNAQVAARQHKTRGGMVEGRWFPCSGGMARFAILCDPRVEVAWYLRPVVIRQMATAARSGYFFKFTRYMT